MDWEIVQNRDFPKIKDLILRKEWAYVSFCSRFREYTQKQHILNNDCTILAHYEKEKNYIREAIMLTQRGIILPILEQPSLNEYSPILYYFFSSFQHYMNRLHSIMGLFDDVIKIEAMLPVQASHQVDYYLMTVTEESLRVPDFFSFHDMVVRKATPKDAEKLYNLQKMYELEEVFIDPSKFNPKICLSNLRNMLKHELIMYVEKNNIPVAKAGTNARGFLTDQIGGVYTHDEERRKGIACCLMYLLLKNIFKIKQIVSLFVKKSNTPAISLYRKLGFEMRENYRISYFFN
ncbi:MAG: GNAT family N-acetyltransferase [Spirochaetales bacterium]|nr:GNAT family N-acetyltransferase [Spirochaetales bacterium]